LAKLIKILAASVGGGIVLGAGIRIGEAIAAQIRVPAGEVRDGLAERLDELEHRLLTIEVEYSPAVITRPESSADASPAETTLAVRDELGRWLEANVSTRMAEVETRLRAESQRSQKQLFEAFAESVQARVIQRISRLEEEVAGQSAAMTELRECSLRTERSVHKLLGGLDRLIVKQAPAPEREDEPAPAEPVPVEPVEPSSFESAPVESAPLEADAIRVTAPVPPPFLATPAKPRRWKIFG
jgi:hypothetical protein